MSVLVSYQILTQGDGNLSEKFIVKRHDLRTTSPVERKIINQIFFCFVPPFLELRNLNFHDLPIATAKTINGLFDISYDQIGISFCHVILDQGSEVIPLYLGGILKFVDHNGFDSMPQFLVYDHRVLFRNFLIYLKIDI